MILLLVILATVTPLAISTYAGFRRSSRAQTEEDYFISGQQVDANNYANTSVGYALQMAAVFLFADWGIRYGVGAFWTVLFWFGGFAVLYMLLPRFVRFRDKPGPMTLHEYLGRAYGGSRRVQLIASAASILGLTGTLMMEVEYTVGLYTPVTEARLVQSLLGIVFVFVGLSYVLKHGFKAEVRAEQVQVQIAYIGFISVLVLCLPFVWKHSSSSTYRTIELVLITTLVVIALAKVDWTPEQWTVRSIFPDRQIFIPVVALAAIAIQRLWWLPQLPAGENGGVLSTPILSQIGAQGTLGVISLFIANVLWMPVDLSTWQRIESVDGSDGKALSRLRDGTRRVVFESPATWSLGVLLGWIIHAGGFLPEGRDASEGLGAFTTALASGTTLMRVLYAVLIASCVAIMLSTIGALQTAVGYTAYRDLIPKSEKSIASARNWSLWILVVGFVLFKALRWGTAANMGTLLYGAYAMQLALIVSVITLFFDGRNSERAAFWSIASGIGGASVATALAILTQQPQFYLLPPILAVGGAVLAYAVVLGIDVEAKSLPAVD